MITNIRPSQQIKRQGAEAVNEWGTHIKVQTNAETEWRDLENILADNISFARWIEQVS